MNKTAGKEAVIFDMDGVIIDSEPDHYRISWKIFLELGIDLPDKDYATLVGTSLPKMWEKLKKEFDLDQKVEDLIGKHRSMITEFFREKTDLQPSPGVVELVKILRAADYRLAIASSTSREVIGIIIDKLGLKTSFDIITGGDQITRGKPAPDIFLKTADDLRCKYGNCIVIEDSTNGVLAAKKAGMKCIGLVNPHSGKQDISAADLIISSLFELDLRTIGKLYD